MQHVAKLRETFSTLLLLLEFWVVCWSRIRTESEGVLGHAADGVGHELYGAKVVMDGRGLGRGRGTGHVDVEHASRHRDGHRVRIGTREQRGVATGAVIRSGFDGDRLRCGRDGDAVADAAAVVIDGIVDVVCEGRKVRQAGREFWNGVVEGHGGEVEHGILASQLGSDLGAILLVDSQLLSLSPRNVVEVEVARAALGLIKLLGQATALVRGVV